MHQPINKYLFIMLFCSITSYAYAQDTLSERSSLKADAWAMQFGISSNFTLTSFQGSTIALKYQLSDKSAIRGGITINGSTNNGNSTTTYSVADTNAGSAPVNSSSDAANVSFVVQYLWYANPNGPVHFYGGLGPSISYSYSNSSSGNSYFYTNEYYDTGYYYYYNYTEKISSKSNSIQWGVGLTGSVGLEWFACQWLSIRAEYGESIQYMWRSSTSSNDYSYIYSPSLPSTYTRSPNSHNDNSGTNKGWTVNSSGVSFGLSVYW